MQTAQSVLFRASVTLPETEVSALTAGHTQQQDCHAWHLSRSLVAKGRSWAGAQAGAAAHTRFAPTPVPRIEHGFQLGLFEARPGESSSRLQKRARGWGFDPCPVVISRGTVPIRTQDRQGTPSVDRSRFFPIDALRRAWERPGVQVPRHCGEIAGHGK